MAQNLVHSKQLCEMETDVDM